MTFPGGSVQSTVVYTNSPSRLDTSWHQLVILVLHYRQSSSLGHNMYQTHPLAIRDWIDDPAIQQLYHFCSHNLLRFWVESSLWFPRRFGIFLKMYLMHNQRGANSLIVLNSPTNSVLGLSQNIQQFLLLIIAQVLSYNHR